MVLAPVQNRGGRNFENCQKNAAEVHFRKGGGRCRAPVRRGAPARPVAGRGNLPGLGLGRDAVHGRFERARYRAGRGVADLPGKRNHPGVQGLVVPEEVVPAVPELQRRRVGHQQRADAQGAVAALPRPGPRGGSSDGAAQLARVPDAAPRLLRLVQALHGAPDHQVLRRARQEEDAEPVRGAEHFVRGGGQEGAVGRRVVSRGAKRSAEPDELVKYFLLTGLNFTFQHTLQAFN